MARVELEALPIKRLLARLRRLRECEESPALSDQTARSESGTIEFKQTQEWIEAFQDVKQVLSGREHVPKGVELTALRAKKARLGKSAERNCAVDAPLACLSFKV